MHYELPTVSIIAISVQGDSNDTTCIQAVVTFNMCKHVLLSYSKSWTSVNASGYHICVEPYYARYVYYWVGYS